MKVLNYQIVPSTQEEDINKGKSIWVNNKIYSIDEGKYITYFVGHYNETILVPKSEDMEENEEYIEKEITYAFSIRIIKPFSIEKIITSATLKAYNITIEEYTAFINDMNTRYSKNKGDETVLEYYSFVDWIKSSIDGTFQTKLDEEKNIMISKIDAYDKSEEVNIFYLNELPVWLDKDTRVGLMNSTQIEKSLGHETTNLWLGSLSLTIPCDLAIGLLSQLEIYALSCYNKTAEHKTNILKLNRIEDVKNYNYKIGYPEKLRLSTKA